MKMGFFFLSLFCSIGLFFNVASASNYDGKILEVSTGKTLTRNDFFLELAKHHLILIGEKHYTQEVQNVEAEILTQYSHSRLPKSLTYGWEFLAWTTQSTTDSAYTDFKSGVISVLDFFKKTVGAADEYAPVLNAAKAENALVVGLNLTRSEKDPVTKSGITALDPKLMPKNFKLGGAGYRERFEEAMRGHATPAQIDNYFASQSLTDEVMGEQTINALSTSDAMVEVMGSFHSDYFDGTYASIKSRDASADVISVRIVDASDFSETELHDYVQNAKYGNLSDYVYYVNEPQ
jgi:uncharacterized iron-regulated protein